MKVIGTFLNILIILVLISILSFFSTFTIKIVDIIQYQLSLKPSIENKNLITLILYLIVGVISLIMITIDNKYFENNYEITFFRKLTASVFRLIGFVSIFFILFSIYMLIK